MTGECELPSRRQLGERTGVAAIVTHTELRVMSIYDAINILFQRILLRLRKEKYGEMNDIILRRRNEFIDDEDSDDYTNEMLNRKQSEYDYRATIIMIIQECFIGRQYGLPRPPLALLLPLTIPLGPRPGSPLGAPRPRILPA